MNLRSCFARELRKQTKYENTSQERRRKYRYYKNMMFLQKHSAAQGVNETQGSEGYRSDNLEDWQGQNTENSYLEDEDSGSDCSVPIKKEKKGFEIVIEDPLEDMKPGPESVETQRQDPDQDINFVMSLVPMFRELPVSQKLKMQVDILKLFQQVVKK
ncbi:uncharacterized protein LOC126376307 isoform X2 [Pectinophora gossypiella]|uniref:BESS domain-containing protein n=2 Tax=Pectinophora gossypiella TaxID=13191 RepID=A0A1E1WP23_PECGO|nr:uncharacterized protein LOC126376307 isoform X2 [Pectinophora gossypiella]